MADRRRRQRRQQHGRQSLLFVLLIAPNLLAILVFSYWPTLYNLYLSLTTWDMIAPMPTFVGLANYQRLLTDPTFGQALGNTVVFTGVTTAGSLLGGVLLGGLLANRLRGSGIVRTLAFAPHMLPGAAVGMLWLFLFDPTYGLSRWFFALFGADSPQWTTTSDWSLWAITLAYLWQRVGFVAIIYYTAILDLPQDVMEAASLDGAHGFSLHWHMSRPLLTPVTLFLTVTGVISAAQTFDIIAALTDGGPGTSSTTLSWLVYDSAFRDFDIGTSAASATILFLGLLLLTFGQLRFNDKWGHA
ncbi:MAG: sugar ABC transporter permease [Propionibacteriales bacterium]|nr:sugar ABC transporter permease [Propionibacteriales bacterium]